MKASFLSKTLSESIKRVTSVTKSPEYVNIKAIKGGGIQVLATGDDVSASLMVKDSKTETAGEVTVPVAQIQGLIKGRGELTIAYTSKKESAVALEGKNYRSEFATPPFAPIEVKTSEAKGVKFNKGIQTLLEEAMSRVSLSGAYTDDPIHLFVGLRGKKGSVVACGDQYHFAHFHHEVDLGTNEFTMPLSTFQVIASLAGKEAYRLFIEGSQVFVSNDNIALAMPLVQSGDELSLEGFNQLVGTFKKTSDCFVDIAKDALSAALSNIGAVYEASVPLELSVKGNKLQLAFRTGHSSLKESLKVSKSKWKDKSVVKVDPALLQDTIASVRSKTVRLQVISGQTIYVRDSSDQITTHHACCVV